MKKSLLLPLLLFIVGGLNAQQMFQRVPVDQALKLDSRKAASPTSMEVGYCDNLESSIGPGTNAQFKTAIQFSESTMKKYAGNDLTKVMVGIGNDTGMKDGKIFLSYGLEQEPFYSQDVTFTKTAWNTITLNTPYRIEGKEIFVGYSLTTGTNSNSSFPIGMDKGPSDSMGDLIALKDKSGKFVWSHLSDFGFSSNLCIKGVLEGDALPQNDISLYYIRSDKDYLNLNGEFNIEATFRNLAAQTITSFDIIYQVGSEAVVTLPVNNVAILNNTIYKFEINDLVAKTEGTIPVKVSITNLNGVKDEDESNNSLLKNVLCTTKSTHRKVLLEHFTTAKCPNCPAGHTILEKALGENENVIWVAHHAGYGVDNYTIPQSEKFMWFYNLDGSTYAPAIMFDRTNLADLGAISNSKPAPAPLFQVSQAIVAKTLEARLNAPAYVTVDIEENYDLATRKLDITVSGNAIAGNLPGNSVRVNVFLTEDGLIGAQSGGGSKYVHNHVMRDVLSDVWGDLVTFDKNGDYKATYSCDLATDWIPANMKIVAFLSNYDFRDVNYSEVYNAESFALKSGSNINSIYNDETVHVYSSNSLIKIEGEFTNADIFDVTGKIVSSINDSGNSVRVANGIYVVKLNVNGHVVLRKVAVNN